MTTELKLPAVYIDRQNHVTIGIRVDGIIVSHIPMAEKLEIESLHVNDFNDRFQLAKKGDQEYQVSRAAAKFTAATHLPITGACARVLKKVMDNEVISEADLYDTAEESPMAAAKKASKKNGKANGHANGSGKRGRAAKFSGASKIKVLVDENPKRGTAAERFKLYRTGMTIDSYVEKGGKRVDINYDVAHKFISIS